MKLTDCFHRESLKRMDWKDFANQDLTFQEVRHVCGLFDNYWQCDPDDPPKYHAEWSSGLCSADFFNLADTLKACQPFCDLLAYHAVGRLKVECLGDFTEVVGSANGSTALARSVAELTGARHLLMEKPQGTKDQVWPVGQAPLTDWSLVGHFEELTSTIATPPRVREAIRQRHAGICAVQFSPVLIVLVDRRSEEEQAADPEPNVDGSRMVGLYPFPSKLYQPGPGTCPMCAKGSIPIRPRGDEGRNWLKLIGKSA